MSRKWIAAAVVLMLGALATWPARVAAQPYPPGPPEIQVETGTPTAGGTVTVRATGFYPGEKVKIFVNFGPVARHGGVPVGTPAITAIADANGTIEVEVPLGQAGTATITAVGAQSGRVTYTVVTVEPALSPTRAGAEATAGEVPPVGGLPITGTGGGGLASQVLIGVLALLAGLALVWTSVRWRRRVRAANQDS